MASELVPTVKFKKMGENEYRSNDPSADHSGIYVTLKEHMTHVTQYQRAVEAAHLLTRLQCPLGAEETFGNVFARLKEEVQDLKARE